MFVFTFDFFTADDVSYLGFSEEGLVVGFVAYAYVTEVSTFTGPIVVLHGGVACVGKEAGFMVDTLCAR